MASLTQTIQKDINNIVCELKKCQSSSKYYDLVNKLEDLQELIFYKQLNVNYPKEIIYEMNKKNLAKEELVYRKLIISNANEMYTYNQKLLKIANILNARYLEPISNYYKLEYVPFQKSIDLASEFFYQYDKDIYEFFINYIETPRFVILNPDFKLDGYVLKNNYIFDSYMVIFKNNLSADFLSLVHETMHAYHFNLLKNMSYKENDILLVNNLQEVPAYFIEHIGLDYLDSINYYPDDIKKLREIFDYELIEDVNNYKKIFDSYDFNIDEYISKEGYAYGKLLSYQFYNNYLKDNEQTKQNIIDFMIDSKTYNKKYLLNNYGLNKNDIMNTQKITKHLDKHLKRVK